MNLYVFLQLAMKFLSFSHGSWSMRLRCSCRGSIWLCLGCLREEISLLMVNIGYREYWKPIELDHP